MQKKAANTSLPLIIAERQRGFKQGDLGLTELGIKLQAPPEPLGTYVEAVQRANLTIAQTIPRY